MGSSLDPLPLGGRGAGSVSLSPILVHHMVEILGERRQRRFLLHASTENVMI